MAEFGVHEARNVKDGCIVIGRCYRGPLARGDVFSLVRPGPAKEPAKSIGILLRVERITAYRRIIDEIDEGLTAELHLSGEGVEHVHAGAVLATG